MMYDKGFFDAHAGYYWPCASLSYWCGYQAGLYAMMRTHWWPL